MFIYDFWKNKMSMDLLDFFVSVLITPFLLAIDLILSPLEIIVAIIYYILKNKEEKEYKEAKQRYNKRHNIS